MNLKRVKCTNYADGSNVRGEKRSQRNVKGESVRERRERRKQCGIEARGGTLCC